MLKIRPFLWFDHQAEEAAKFYCSVFEGSKITQVTRYGDAGPGPKGSVMTVAFQLGDQEVVALNGGPHQKLTEAFSFTIECETQQEVDHYWQKLTAGGGEENVCGWLKDRFGLSWQVVPKALLEMLGDLDATKTQRAMKAMFTMKKLDVEALRRAYEGR